MKNLPKKHRDLLVKARELFWKFGLKRVTVEEICAESGVSKMTFYKYFANKNELAMEVLDRMFTENMARFREVMRSERTMEEKMQWQVQMKMEGTTDISQEFIKDVYGDKESEVHQFWAERTSQAIGEVMEEYRHAQEQGWIRKDMKIEFILYLVNKFFDFANDEALIAQYDTMQDVIIEINKFFLYGILPHHPAPGEAGTPSRAEQNSKG
ncbi:MAG: TetR/AcrR family transcriptional regulator [Bacteroidales bacterium]